VAEVAEVEQGLTATEGRVAVVEDDLALGQQIVDVLAQAGLAAQWFKRGQDFVGACGRPEAFDVALLDMRLPDMTGLAVLENLLDRAPPVVMLTGMTEEAGLVRAFELGVHDYVFKPFRANELVARLKGLVRRTRRELGGAEPLVAKPSLLTDHPAYTSLTEKERGCAEVLLGQLGQTVSRETLRRLVWRGHQVVTSRSIDTHVSRVRTKLGLVPSAGFELASVYGVGYRLQKLA
jgi:DNA-binding response OmpR family regulator